MMQMRWTSGHASSFHSPHLPGRHQNCLSSDPPASMTTHAKNEVFLTEQPARTWAFDVDFETMQFPSMVSTPSTIISIESPSTGASVTPRLQTKKPTKKLKRKRGTSKATIAITASRRSTSRSIASSTGPIPLKKKVTMPWVKVPKGENHQQLLDSGFFQRMENLPKRKIVRTPVAIKIPSKRLSFRPSSVVSTPSGFYMADTSHSRHSRTSWSSLRLSWQAAGALQGALPPSLAIAEPHRFSRQLELALERSFSKSSRPSRTSGLNSSPRSLGFLAEDAAEDGEWEEMVVETESKSAHESAPDTSTATNHENQGGPMAQAAGATAATPNNPQTPEARAIRRDEAAESQREAPAAQKVVSGNDARAREPSWIRDGEEPGQSQDRERVRFDRLQPGAGIRSDSGRRVRYQHGPIKLSKPDGTMETMGTVAPWVVHDVWAENEKADEAMIDDILAFFLTPEGEASSEVEVPPPRPASAPAIDAFLAKESASRSLPWRTAVVALAKKYKTISLPLRLSRGSFRATPLRSKTASEEKAAKGKAKIRSAFFY